MTIGTCAVDNGSMKRRERLQRLINASLVPLRGVVRILMRDVDNLLRFFSRCEPSPGVVDLSAVLRKIEDGRGKAAERDLSRRAAL
jgi:hypothetical protein